MTIKKNTFVMLNAIVHFYMHGLFLFFASDSMPSWNKTKKKKKYHQLNDHMRMRPIFMQSFFFFSLNNKIFNGEISTRKLQQRKKKMRTKKRFILLLLVWVRIVF